MSDLHRKACIRGEEAREALRHAGFEPGFLLGQRFGCVRVHVKKPIDRNTRTVCGYFDVLADTCDFSGLNMHRNDIIAAVQQALSPAQPPKPVSHVVGWALQSSPEIYHAREVVARFCNGMSKPMGWDEKFHYAGSLAGALDHLQTVVEQAISARYEVVVEQKAQELREKKDSEECRRLRLEVVGLEERLARYKIDWEEEKSLDETEEEIDVEDLAERLTNLRNHIDSVLGKIE